MALKHVTHTRPRGQEDTEEDGTVRPKTADAPATRKKDDDDDRRDETTTRSLARTDVGRRDETTTTDAIERRRGEETGGPTEKTKGTPPRVGGREASADTPSRTGEEGARPQGRPKQASVQILVVVASIQTRTRPED
jgi:hypothetical protein